MVNLYFMLLFFNLKGLNYRQHIMLMLINDYLIFIIKLTKEKNLKS